MRVALANPPCVIPLSNGLEKYFIRAGSRWPFSVVKPRTQCLCDYLPFPFYLAYATALLERAGIETCALDAVAMNWDEEQTLDLPPASRMSWCSNPPLPPSAGTSFSSGG